MTKLTAQKKSWVVPDLATVAALVALFYCLFLFQGYTRLLRDADAGWHIRTGERILATQTLPRADPYSFSKPGQPWFAWEWGADVLTGAIHRGFGLRGVVFVYALAIAAAVWLWFRLHWAVGGNFLLAGALAAPLLTTTQIHWMARPHVFSWIFLLLWTLWCERGRGRWWWALAFGALWANVHASFFFAPLIAAIYAAGRWSRPSWYLRTGAAAAAGSLLNPYGWGLHQHLAAYLTNVELLRRVREFQSFDFQSEGSFQILLTVVIVFMGGAWALVARRPEHFLLCGLLAAGSLRSARVLPLIALICLPLANGSATVLLARATHSKLRAFLAYGERLRALDARAGGALLALTAGAGMWILLGRLPVGFPSDQFPTKIDILLPDDARLFSSDKFGGYLIYKFSGTQKVFFDGRSDYYGLEFLRQYGEMVELRPGWRDRFDRWRFSHALVSRESALGAALEQSGWRRLAEDRVGVLLASPSARMSGTY